MVDFRTNLNIFAPILKINTACDTKNEFLYYAGKKLGRAPYEGILLL